MVRPVASLGIVLRGRRRESYAVAQMDGFCGPVRQIACAWACRACGAVPWNAVAGCDDGRRACRACGVFGAVPCGLLVGAVPWGLLLGVLHGWRCAMGIAGQRVLSVAPCLRDC